MMCRATVHRMTFQRSYSSNVRHSFIDVSWLSGRISKEVPSNDYATSSLLGIANNEALWSLSWLTGMSVTMTFPQSNSRVKTGCVHWVCLLLVLGSSSLGRDKWTNHCAYCWSHSPVAELPVMFPVLTEFMQLQPCREGTYCMKTNSHWDSRVIGRNVHDRHTTTRPKTPHEKVSVPLNEAALTNTHQRKSRLKLLFHTRSTRRRFICVTLTSLKGNLFCRPQNSKETLWWARLHLRVTLFAKPGTQKSPWNPVSEAVWEV